VNFTAQNRRIRRIRIAGRLAIWAIGISAMQFLITVVMKTSALRGINFTSYFIVLVLSLRMMGDSLDHIDASWEQRRRITIINTATLVISIILLAITCSGCASALHHFIWRGMFSILLEVLLYRMLLGPARIIRKDFARHRRSKRRSY